MDHLTNTPQPVTEADDSIMSSGLSETEQEEQAWRKQQTNARLLAVRKAQDAQDEANEKSQYISDSVPKSDRGGQKKHKSIKREALAAGWAEVVAAWGKVKAHEQKLAEDERDLAEKKKVLEDAQRMVGAMSAESDMRKSLSSTDREMRMGGEQEASCYGDAVLSQNGEKIDPAKWLKDDNLGSPIDRELRMTHCSTLKGEECLKEGIALAPSFTGHPATTSTTTATSTKGVNNPGYPARLGKEEKLKAPNERPALRQVGLKPPGGARNNDAECKACGLMRAAHLPRSLDCPGRALTWSLCAILLAVGIAMIIAASLQLREAKKERNLWLQANGLTRAYLLAIAPAGSVD